MKKLFAIPIILFLLLIGVVFAAATDWQLVMQDFYQKEFSKQEIQDQWKTGIKNNFQLDMQRLEVKVEILEVLTTAGEGTFLALKINRVAYCLDSNGLKNRVVGSIDVIILIKDLNDITNAPAQILGIEQLHVQDGWDGKDI